MKSLTASWKTTIAGIVLAGSLILPELNKAFDDDETTNPDWNIIVAALGAGVLGVGARDSDVSSENAGAK